MAFNYSKPKFHMGQKIVHNDTEKFIHSVPGPGTHSPVTNPCKSKAPTYSMGCKLGSSLVKKSIVPGPGQYVNESHKMKTAAPSYGFGTMKRPDIAGNKTLNSPGPGAYKIPVKIGDVANHAMPNRQEAAKFV